MRHYPDSCLPEDALRPDDEDIDEALFMHDRYEAFRWDLYDWSRFDPEVYGYSVIRLGGGSSNGRRKSKHSGVYFTIVDNYFYPLLTANDKKWYPNVQYGRSQRCGNTDTIMRIYATHTSKGRRGERTITYMHRFIAAKDGFDVTDHMLGRSLDNRTCMLCNVSYGVNNHNTLRPNVGILRPGVEWRNRARTLVGGVVKIAGQRIRSERTWPLAEQHQAHQWYLDALKQYHGRDEWVHSCVDSLVFPPLRDTSIIAPEDDIPF